jgi:hypothetical protein
MMPVGCHTMWARGQYTVMCHKLMKMHSAEGFTLWEHSTAYSVSMQHGTDHQANALSLSWQIEHVYTSNCVKS